MLNFLEESKLNMIRKATAEEISDMILAVQARYHELFPDWTMHITVIEKKGDTAAQIDRMIAQLERLKEK